jgi:hypothetical protein
MSTLFMETYITLLIHFVKKGVKSSDALAWVVNCIFIYKFSYYRTCILHVSNVPSKLRGRAVIEMFPRTLNWCRAAGIFQSSL